MKTLRDEGQSLHSARIKNAAGTSGERAATESQAGTSMTARCTLSRQTGLDQPDFDILIFRVFAVISAGLVILMVKTPSLHSALTSLGSIEKPSGTERS